MTQSDTRSLDEWLAWQEQIHPASIEMSLERIREVAERLQLFTASSTKVVTVAGTNGKGSTIAFLEAILREAGYKVGCYTSPHILRYNERVRIQGEEVDDLTLCGAFSRVEQAREETPLTYFEFGTLAAISILQHAQLDVMLLEVGLGGRLDAVNIIDPDLAVVTSIDLDHMDWLGDNRESIGREKAGIFRFGVPVVCGDRSPPVSVTEHAKSLGAPFHCLGKTFDFERGNNDWAWHAETERRVGLPEPHLKGSFQYSNAATALMALALLKQDLPVSQSDTRAGLMDVKLPGRFQVLSTSPLVIIDVAHNAQGARALAQSLSSQPCDGQTIAIFSMLQDKDIKPVLQALAPHIDEWHVAGMEDIPRGVSMLQMLQRIDQTEVNLVSVFPYKDLCTAYDQVIEQAKPEDRIVIFGSFFVVAEILKARIIGAG